MKRRYSYQPRRTRFKKESRLLRFFGFYLLKERDGFRKFVYRNFLIAGAAFIILIISIFAWYSKDLPDPKKLHERRVVESTVIYDRTGASILYDIHGEVKRTVVPLSEISDYMKQATIAIEDQSFYRHHGVNIKGIIRAIISNIKGGPLQGGSSITQQLIKNSILTPERTYARKFKELILAIEMEQKFTKDQILEMYLNEIPYGSNAYGVEAASQTYFNTSAKDLTLPQAAILASLPKAPTYYSPYGSHPEALKSRQEAVLDNMVEMGFITEEEAETAKNTKLSFAEIRENITAPHFVMYVKEKLEKKFDKKLVEQGGLKVYTTLDLNIQRVAEEAVRNGVEKNIKNFNARNAALVGIDPKTGEILAMVGSRDYFDRENDGNVNVAIRDRQPGSSFKPFVYATAFKKGFTPNTILIDARTSFSKDYAPRNYDGKERGPVRMKDGLAMSLNIPSVKTLYLAGMKDVLNFAHEAGFTTLNDPDRYGLSLVLGGGEVKLLDETAAFGVFATEGKKYPLTAILKIEDKYGNVLEDNTDQEGKQVLDEEIARQINYILSDNSLRAPMFGASSPLNLKGRQAAVKTGTTQEYRDAWTIGYTPSLVAGVWVGNNDNSKMKNAPGIYAAAPIWKDFMEKVLEGTQVEEFTKPKPVETSKPILNGKLPEEKIRIDKKTKKLVPDGCEKKFKTEEKTLVELHSILYFVNKDDPRGKFQNITDPQFIRWEDGVKKWIEKNPEKDGKLYKRPDPVICNKEDIPKINITSPGNSVKGSEVSIEANIDAKKGIKRVEFYFGGNLIQTFENGPFKYHYSLPDGSNTHGRFSIEVKAYDKAGNLGRVKKTVSINSDSDNPSVELVRPRNNETISSFPYKIEVKASDPSGINYVDFMYRDKNGRDSRIARVTSSGDNLTYRASWEDKPKKGEYRVYVIAVDKTGNQTKTSSVSINVK